MGEEDPAGIFILQLLQAAAAAAIAQAFPFGVGHLFQRLGFPEETLLVGDWLGRRGHGFGWSSEGSLGTVTIHLGGGTVGAQVRGEHKHHPSIRSVPGRRSPATAALLALAIKTRRRSIGLMAPLG